MKILFLVMSLGLAACNSSTSVDLCKYVSIKPQYSFLFGSREIKSCKVIDVKSEASKVEGHKYVDIRGKLDLEIVYSEDDCYSEADMRCGMTSQGCLKDDNGKRLGSCHYPDKKIEHKKGDTFKMMRAIHLVGTDGDFSVMSNNEVK